MAVAALSTSAIALATVPAAMPAPATGETPEAFAELVSRAKPDGQASKGDTKPQTTDGEAETAESAIGKTTAEPESEAKAIAPDQPVDLLAEIEALFAFSGQINIITPAPAATPSASIAAPAASAPAAPITPSPATPEIMPPGIAQPAMAATPVKLPIATIPIAAAEDAAAADAEAIPINPALRTDQPAPHIAADAGTRAAATTTTIRRDIASIVASLKAAFHPVETTVEIPVALASTPTVSAIVVPVAQAATAIAAAPVAIPGIVAPATSTADMTTPIPAEAKVSEQVANIGATSETFAKSVRSTAGKAAAAFAIDRADPAVSAVAPESVLPPVALADAPAPDSAEQAASAATPAIASVPLSAAPVIPATVAPAITTDTQVADVIMAAPNHAEQSVARHLDLARDTQWLDQLARDISQSVAQQGHLKFQLNPEHLGALTVEIANSANGAAIKLSAETDQARAIIADAQPRLIAEVRAQGVRVADAQVDSNQQGSGNSSAFAQGQQRQPSEDSKPFARTQTVNREDAADSAPREDDELYA
ncbi:flagellar hook-length control protein FliK [Sphingomonas sp. SRS2]|uniref:flagellar hook-length control protein FliK n=1 Tax=Sphingomonas sp. SRS2 TaxID=133190 RepID=UPI000618411C|nr:flagellar hook-length control protein FliK [Sphingomonas sp. SRS2]KKC25277.1 hypothetical protein WP12_14565 [Sphingomonas sp. SRS2]